MAKILSENRYFQEYIKETGKFVKSSEALSLRLKADKYYNELVAKSYAIVDARAKHCEESLFATLAFYRCMVEEYPDIAMQVIETGIEVVAKELCEKHKKFTKLPGMKTLFMKNLGRDTKKSYGTAGGFDTRFISENGTYVQYDVKKCFFKTYCEEYGYPEVAHVFCRIEEIEYSDIPGISFTRKHNLVNGDDMCDFRYEHINELIYGKKG